MRVLSGAGLFTAPGDVAALVLFAPAGYSRPGDGG
jgi:hypothetical protein